MTVLSSCFHVLFISPSSYSIGGQKTGRERPGLNELHSTQRFPPGLSVIMSETGCGSRRLRSLPGVHLTSQMW
ncbi:MAG: hypothetical protein H6Q31_1720 [Bacteroidetes bacterium]|nr:hypothetical protein [Bacteroidota bacterium]